jgi:hypothetical protein
MRLSLHLFEQLLAQAPTAQLQKFARAWGVREKLRKDQALKAIAAALGDHNRITRHINDLTPLAQAALAFLALRGAPVESNSLALALAGAGHELPSSSPDDYGASFSAELNQQGVALVLHSDVFDDYTWYSFGVVLSDERLVHAAPAFHGLAPALAAIPAPAAVHSRRPGAVMLDLLAVLQAVAAQNGLGLTRTNTVRVGDIRKLSRALAWDEAEMRFDGLLFQQPIAALVEAMEAGLVLTGTANKLVTRDLAGFTARSSVQQVRAVLLAFTDLPGWREGPIDYWGGTPRYYNAMRAALVGLLASLPPGDAFYALDDLSTLLYERVGHLASLRGLPLIGRMYGFRPRGESRKLDKDDSEADQANRRRWQNDERPWLSYAVSSWLYFLGIVDVGLENKQVVAVRLTEFGYRVLHADAEELAGAAAGPAWMIQPDFEVLVYLEHADARQLAFAERVAERVQVASHVARYKLSRDSVYQALEQGTTLAEMLDELAAHSSAPLPQNVAASIREWAAQRDRISIHRETSLLEFPTAQARDEVLAAGMKGRPIGERFVELSAATAQSLSAARSVDYTRPMARCLAVDDSGLVTLARPAFDLLVRPMLDRWAEPAGPDTWRLTAERVAAASGRASAAGLLAFLEQRLVGELSPWLRTVLRSWAGERVPARVGRVTVLQFEDLDAAQAVQNNPMFHGLVVGSLGPRALLIDQDRMAEVRELLEWARFDVTIADD